MSNSTQPSTQPLVSSSMLRRNSLLALTMLLLTLVIGIMLFVPTAQAESPDPTSPVQSAPAGRPQAQDEVEWTIMMYHVADDEQLEQDIMIDLNEAELVGSTEDVNIVVQSDRFIGSYDGMGDWASTKRFYLTQDDDLTEIGSEELEDLGEMNMADGATLVDFITWTVENFPAKKYALIMSDHGMGWPGGFADPDPGELGADDIYLAYLFGGDALWLMEIDRSLEEARYLTGIDQFELVVLDVCLMGQLEVFTTLAPHSRYAVASEELVPGIGYAYAASLAELVNNPGMDGAELGTALVANFVERDERLLNDDTRLELVGGQDVPADAVIAEIFLDATLTAVDLAGIPDLNLALDDFAVSLTGLDPEIVAEARAYAQPYQSPLDAERPSSFIDLGNFALWTTELSGDSAVASATENLFFALQNTIVAEKHGDDRPGSTGISIYFPTSEAFAEGDNFGYSDVAARFADETQWDEFLTAFYVGGGPDFSRQAEEDSSAAPEIISNLSDEDWAVLEQDVIYLQEEGYTSDEMVQILVGEYGWPEELILFLADNGLLEASTSRVASRSAAAAVGPKPIQMEPISLSTELTTPDQPVTIGTEVSGDRLAYIYSFIGRYLPREDVLLIEDMDYILADENKEIGGVTRPVWPAEGVAIDFEWTPTIYSISDGQTSVRALIRPQSYDAASPTYVAEGIYTFAGSGNRQYAQMLFREGEMTQVIGFTSGITQAIGAPRQITPNQGDTFTVLERGDDLTQEGDAGRETYVRESGTLTFGDVPFIWEETPAPSGNYLVGFIAEDLDGQTFEQYESIFVQNDEAGPVDGLIPYVNEELGFALLYPEIWQIEEDQAEETVTFSSEDSTTLTLIARSSYPDATSADEANNLGIQEVIDSLGAEEDLNIQFSPEVTDTILGAFDAKYIDFTLELEGVPFYGEVFVSTPIPTATYAFMNLVPEADFDAAVAEFDSMLYSFDILISGVSKEQIGPAAPDFASESFTDDFSDPSSGLIQDEEFQEWGRGYYDRGQYIFELLPSSDGAIYDYYSDQSLSDSFMIQATGSFTGAIDNAYGVIFQVVVGEETEDFYTFRISGDGFYTVEKTEGDKLVPLIDWTESSLIDQTEGAANILTVVGQGDTYDFYINGQQVDSVTDATYSGGSFGFMVENYEQEAPANFSFSDLIVGEPAVD